jgi:hypothetical protein
MQATVCRLRQRGIRLPRPLYAVPGNLLLTKGVGTDGRPTLKAQLVEGERLALPSLERAAVRRVTANGIVIAGTEIVARRNSNKSSADHWPQTWWCLVPTVSLAADWTGMYEELEHRPGASSF